MMLIHLIFLYLSYFQAVQAQVQTRIVGGSETTIDKVPYIVQLRLSGKFSCGGSLIDSRTVVTAAHCIDGYEPADFTVVGSSTYLSGNTISSKVSRIIKSTKYNSETLHMDIAVLKLVTPFTTINKIELCNKELPVGASVQIAGWGLTSQDGSRSEQVRKVNVTMFSRKRCIDAYENTLTFSTTMMCGSQKGKDSCSGDSGGPLVYNNKLYGVVSYGVGCAHEDFPGVYTNINTVHKFIAKARLK